MPSIRFAFFDKIIRLTADWCCSRHRCGSETSILRTESKPHFPPKYQYLLCAASFESFSHLFSPLLPTVPPVLCARHQNTTQPGKANFKVREIPNCQSAASTGHCTTTKIVPSVCCDADVVVYNMVRCICLSTKSASCLETESLWS